MPKFPLDSPECQHAALLHPLLVRPGGSKEVCMAHLSAVEVAPHTAMGCGGSVVTSLKPPSAAAPAVVPPAIALLLILLLYHKQNRAAR